MFNEWKFFILYRQVHPIFLVQHKLIKKKVFLFFFSFDSKSIEWKSFLLVKLIPNEIILTSEIILSNPKEKLCFYSNSQLENLGEQTKSSNLRTISNNSTLINSLSKLKTADSEILIENVKRKKNFFSSFFISKRKFRSFLFFFSFRMISMKFFKVHNFKIIIKH